MSYRFENKDLPHGLSVSDVERLKHFAERVVEHAVREFIALSLNTEPPSLDRDYYIKSLFEFGALSPAAVEFLGREKVQEINVLFSNDCVQEAVNALHNHYAHGEKLPEYITYRPELHATCMEWKALANIQEFCQIFATRVSREDEPPHILKCLQEALDRNRLRQAWNTIDIKFDMVDNDTALGTIILLVPAKPLHYSDKLRFSLLDLRLST